MSSKIQTAVNGTSVRIAFRFLLDLFVETTNDIFFNTRKVYVFCMFSFYFVGLNVSIFRSIAFCFLFFHVHFKNR